MIYEGKRVLVTGSSGFVGSHLRKRLLELGAAVGEFDLARTVFEDVRGPATVRRWVAKWEPHLLIHLAAQAFVPRGFTDPQLTFETNAQGTVNVLDAVRSAAPHCPVLVVTSDKTYGETGPTPARENSILSPTCPYSASKVAAEAACDLYRAIYGLRVATARAGNIIGPGDHFGVGRLVPNAIEALREKRPVPVYNPRAVRPWQFIEDVIEGYLLLGERLLSDPAAARPWNFGPRDHHTVAEVVSLVIESWGEGRFELVRSELREVNELRIDSSRAREILGWIPKWSFEDMIRETIRIEREIA